MLFPVRLSEGEKTMPEYLTDILTLRTMLLVLINVGCVFRVAYCAICASASYEEKEMYFKRMKYAIIFGIMANLLIAFKDVFFTYYPGV